MRWSQVTSSSYDTGESSNTGEPLGPSAGVRYPSGPHQASREHKERQVAVDCDNAGETTMVTKTAITLVCVLSLSGGAAFAQTDLPAPLGITSPLGIGPGSSVGPAGIPMGATELATPGLSPALTSNLNTPCSMTSGVTAGSNAPFDGNGSGGSAPGTCATMGSGQTGPLFTSPTSPGGARIPLGATELAPGGLSPLPLDLPRNRPSVSLAPLGSGTSWMGQTTRSNSSTFGRSVPSNGR
jgi:hypothetical protein